MHLSEFKLVFVLLHTEREDTYGTYNFKSLNLMFQPNERNFCSTKSPQTGVSRL